MSPDYSEMTSVAREYCRVIEQFDVLSEEPLARLNALLPRLHAAVSRLGDVGGEDEPTLMPDLDARFEMFTRLRTLLGEHDGYWMEFDVNEDQQSMSGSLADDLTDIYCELKHGLTLLDGHPDDPYPAFDGWRSSYRLHWGQHLVDAERHLYELQAQNRL